MKQITNNNYQYINQVTTYHVKQQKPASLKSTYDQNTKTKHFPYKNQQKT